MNNAEPFVEPASARTEDRPYLLHLAGWEAAFPGLSAGFTSRWGGVSETPFGTLNCGLHVRDEAADVVSNRRRIAEALEQPFEAFTYAEQVHSADVAVVGSALKGAGRDARETAIQDRDGFVTNEKGIFLCTQYADCVPLFFYDPEHQAVGLAHAGWKGTVLNIAMSTISLMTHTFGSRPANIRAAIGPSIGQCCYEVDDTVASRVYEALASMQASEEAVQTIITSKPNGKYMLSLQALNQKFMEQAGILSSHIEVTQLCTSCRTDLFFSHRKEGGSTGRMIAWIGMHA
ncbi:peptidoglycan editing factor PgeF [Paenibacillus oryzisoli]|uniref:peptidoglycan editing factor PgeF n=1 Tax=Paenibacillus oryzisoli TaxID=1850517 RepID=UPI003D274901